MKTIILFFIILISFVYTCSAQERDFSDEIRKKQSEKCGDKQYLKKFEYNRNKVGWVDEIKNLRKDTIYIVEKYIYDVEVARKYAIGSMWQKREGKEGKLLQVSSYFQENENIKSSNESYFSSYIIFLVNNWDLEQIRKEELGSKPINPSPMVATRLIVHNDCTQIDCICFDEFINMDRDNKYDSIIMNNK